jgi:acetoacetyl-CoA reductase
MQGKVALVTGGTGGIGTAICQELAKRGCKVAANYLEGVDDGLGWQAKQKAEGFDFFVVPGNVSDYDSSVEMVKAVTEKLGPVDILVNCAGITKDGTLKKMKKEQWYDVINVNLNSVFNATKPVIDSMLDRGVDYGRIINISSVNGQKGQLGQTNYSAAKAGMHGFTMALAQEVAKKKITVNTVSPGYIATAMVMAIPEDVRNKIIATVPVGRLAEPSEIAHTVAFLADDRSGFITGANIAINGGLHMGP